MKLVILAGGLGTRLSEETDLKPKPMVEIGGMPILWHIMKYYSSFGVSEFIILAGYKSKVIKDFFQNYNMLRSDVRFNLKEKKIETFGSKTEDWKVSVIDTGQHTMTGGRLKRARHLFRESENFYMTYGDGLSDVDINKLTSLHKNKNPLITITAVTPPGRFGAVTLKGDLVTNFTEKPTGEDGWINGGFFVVNEKAIDFIDGDDTSFEQGPLQAMQEAGRVLAFKHTGYWQPMDTIRDKFLLEKRWGESDAPWKVWND